MFPKILVSLPLKYSLVLSVEREKERERAQDI